MCCPLGLLKMLLPEGKGETVSNGEVLALCRFIVMSWWKANLAALVSCLCSKKPGNAKDFSSVIQLLVLPHCLWRPQRSFSELAISRLQTHCCGESREHFSELSCKCQHSQLPAVKGAMPGTSQLVLLPNGVVGVSDGTGHIWLCCRISPQFFTTKYYDSFKRNPTAINFQVKFLLSTYYFILKWKTIFLRISEVSVKWKCFL